MNTCCGPECGNEYDEVFDARFARGVARRYRRKGLSRAERRIVEFVTSVGITDATVLEIGGGVGEIQLELLARGAARSVNLELSRGYEREAARLIAEAGVSGRVRRLLGIDIARDPESVERADIVVLHRVVCCYSDADRLLSAAADHARRAVVFSHPPDWWGVRAFVRASNVILRLSGRSYRGFVHSPAAMFEVLRRHGLDPRRRRGSMLWKVVGAVRV